jgi:hypothetical protein
VTEESTVIEDTLLDKTKVLIYPNPFSRNLTISLDGYANKEVRIRIFNAFGQLYIDKIYHVENSIQEEFNFETFDDGLYIINISTSNTMSSYKVIKTH